MLRPIIRWFQSCFGVPAIQPHTTIVIETVRIVFALLSLHRAFSMVQFASIVNDPVQTSNVLLAQAICALCILLGVWTPLALLVLIGLHINGVLVYSLGVQVAVMVCWGLILLGAGRAFSLDRLLADRWRAYARLMAIPYCLSAFGAPISARRLMIVRFLLLFMFYGASFSAMMFHLWDELWPTGGLLPLALTTPVTTPFHAQFASLRDLNPQAFRGVLFAALVVQSVWELLLIPLMSFRVGRVFVAVQGIVFFIISALVFQLGYLPQFELCLWALIFGYPAFWRPSRTSPPLSTDRTASPRKWIARIPAGAVILALALIVIEFMIANVRAFAYWSANDVPHLNTDIDRPYKLSLFQNRSILYAAGQQPVVVFSAADLYQFHTYMVVYETNPSGEANRLLSVLDAEGGRLSWFQNDLFLYSPGMTKYIIDPPITFAPNVVESVHAYIALDLCLSGTIDYAQPGRTYRASIFSRQLDQSGSIPVWSAAQWKESISIVLNDQHIGAARRWCSPVWDTSPRREVTFGLRPDEQARLQSLVILRGLQDR